MTDFRTLPPMPKRHATSHLDAAAFAAAAEQRSGESLLSQYPRVAEAALAVEPAAPVRWKAEGEYRVGTDGVRRPALHLTITTEVPQECQRCLQRVDVPVAVDRHFLFASDEAAAAALDAESEDDVLALDEGIDLPALIEDEILLALPMIPQHVQCKVTLPRSTETADFAASQTQAENPFAVLARHKPH